MEIASDFRHVLDFKGVINAFLYSGYPYVHEDGVRSDEKPLFIIMKERIVKFGGDGLKTFVFETEDDAFDFLESIPCKENHYIERTILHMTRSPTANFIGQLVQLAQHNDMNFKIPFTKLHAACTTFECYHREYPNQNLDADERAIKRHLNRRCIGRVLVKVYDGFYKNRLRDCLFPQERGTHKVKVLHTFIPRNDICLGMLFGGL